MAQSTDQRTARHEAEQAVLGTLLCEMFESEQNRAFAALKPRDFDDEQNRRVYAAMQEMWRRKKQVDLISLNDAHPELDAVHLADLLRAQLVTSAQLGQYIEILKAATARRDFLSLGEHLRRASVEDEFDAVKLTEKIRLYLKNMDQVSGEETGIQDKVMQLYDAIFDKPKDEWAVKTGIDGLDELLDGLRPGRMYVIGARPGTGKTVFGLTAALRCAIAGKPALYINREMEDKDLLKRQVAAMSTATMDELKGGVLPEEKWESTTDALSALANLPIHISSQSKTPAEIRTKAVEIYEKHGLGLIVIDYLQRLRPDGRCRSRDEEVGQMSNAIKDLALDLKAPVILLSQLNRDEQNRRPSMSRLRESGNIEQDADVVVLLHEPDEEDVPQARREKRRGIYGIGGKYIEMIVDKNRHGRVGIVPAAFFGSIMRYKGL